MAIERFLRRRRAHSRAANVVFFFSFSYKVTNCSPRTRTFASITKRARRAWKSESSSSRASSLIFRHVTLKGLSSTFSTHSIQSTWKHG